MTLVEPEQHYVQNQCQEQRFYTCAAIDSRYSIDDTAVNNHHVAPVPHRSASTRTAEDRARSYQNLLSNASAAVQMSSDPTTPPAIRSSSHYSIHPVLEDQELNSGTREPLHAQHPDRMSPSTPSLPQRTSAPRRTPQASRLHHRDTSVTHRLPPTSSGGTTRSDICKVAAVLEVTDIVKLTFNP